MGFFSNLFGKNMCSICGKSLTLLGTQDLADGVMCKECNASVSPYLKNRKNITVAQMLDHINFRLDNQNNLLGFSETRHLNVSDTPVSIDENNKCMLICDHRYYHASSFKQENPDIIWFDQITGAQVHIHEIKSVFRDNRPDMPPAEREEYTYNFEVELYLNSTWIQTLHFIANNSPIPIHETANLNTAYDQLQDFTDFLGQLGVNVQFSDDSVFGFDNVLKGSIPPALLHPECPPPVTAPAPSIHEPTPTPMEYGAAYGMAEEMHKTQMHSMNQPRPMNQPHSMEQPRSFAQNRSMNQSQSMNQPRPMNQPHSTNQTNHMEQPRSSGPMAGSQSIPRSDNMTRSRSSADYERPTSGQNMNQRNNMGGRGMEQTGFDNAGRSAQENNRQPSGNSARMSSAGSRPSVGNGQSVGSRPSLGNDQSVGSRPSLGNDRSSAANAAQPSSGSRSNTSGTRTPSGQLNTNNSRNASGQSNSSNRPASGQSNTNSSRPASGQSNSSSRNASGRSGNGGSGSLGNRGGNPKDGGRR